MYKIIRKNILFVGLAILLFSIFINIPIWLNAKDKIFSEVNDLPESEVALLLGTSKYLPGGHKNAFYYYRIDAAEKMLKSGKVKKVILSGSKDVGYDEVKWMKEDLLKKGIDENKLILDKKGDRTESSIENAIDLGYTDFIVISQEFHLERALFLGLLKGVNLIGFSAESPNTIYSSKIYFREIFARIKLLFVDMLFG